MTDGLSSLECPLPVPLGEGGEETWKHGTNR